MATETLKYEVIIYWSEDDNAFIAEMPELPGCAADGATLDEALANVQIVAAEWIETAHELGREVPKPRGRLLDAADLRALRDQLHAQGITPLTVDAFDQELAERRGE